MENKFCTKTRPAECLTTQILWAIGYIIKQLVSV